MTATAPTVVLRQVEATPRRWWDPRGWGRPRAAAPSFYPTTPVQIAAPSARPDYEERGISGTRISGGYIWDYEQNWNLRGPAWVEYEELMRRTDPVVRQCDFALIQTLLSARWRFVAPTNASPMALRATRFCNQAFGFDGCRGRLRGGFERYLRQILRFLTLGYRYLEEVYCVEDGMVWLDYYADREPRAHYRWIPDEITGELLGVEQQRGYSPGSTFVAENPVIPADKFVLFTLDGTGSNWEGLGLLRPCAFAYKLKMHILDMTAIGSERWAVPTPHVVTDKAALLAAGFTDPQITEMVDEAQANAKKLTTHDQAWLSSVVGIKFESYGDGKFDPSAALAVARWCDQQITHAFLLGFQQLGINDTGSRSVAEVQESFFRRTAVNILDQIAQVVGGPAGPGCGTVGRLLDWNFPLLPAAERPTLVHDGLEAKSLLDLAVSTLPDLVRSGLWTADDATEAALRHDAGAPPMSERRTSAERLGVSPAPVMPLPEPPRIPEP